MKARPEHKSIFAALHRRAAPAPTYQAPDRVTRLRLWAEAENISKDAIECAITYKRNHVPSLSDYQVQFLASSINAAFWRAFEKGVKLGRDLGQVCEHCGQDVGDECDEKTYS